MVTDAFGVVAMVAMTPLITIQIMGLGAKLLEKQRKKSVSLESPVLSLDMLEEDAIIEL